MPRSLPGRPSLLQYRKQAKDLLRGYASGDAAAIARFRAYHPQARRLPAPSFQLSDAQWVLAREHGSDSWRAFTCHLSHILAGSVASDAVAAAVELDRPSSREVNLGVFLEGVPAGFSRRPRENRCDCRMQPLEKCCGNSAGTVTMPGR
jgi:hypothetical protein